MPIRDAQANRIVPANNRAVDVAKKALREITPIQQRRYDNAFQVNSYQALVYNRLDAGLPCSCQASGKVLGTLLGEDGKMPEGKINEMVTGGMMFKVKRYGAREPEREDLRVYRGDPAKTRDDTTQDGLDSENQLTPPLNNGKGNFDDPFASEIDQDTQTLDDQLIDFDSLPQDVSDVSCGICFGSGYVGGFSVLGSWRQVLSTQWPELRLNPGATIEVTERPNFFRSLWAEFDTILPCGFTALDSCRVWNNTRPVGTARMLIDGNTATYSILRQMCDGYMHKVRVEFDVSTDWTHLELQVGLINSLAHIDFPNLAQSADVAKLDQTEDLTINTSSSVPTLGSRDVIIEHTFGKAFHVGACNGWNDAAGNQLGWTATVRVLQPNEILNILPRRRWLGNQAANPVRRTSDQP